MPKDAGSSRSQSLGRRVARLEALTEIVLGAASGDLKGNVEGPLFANRVVQLSGASATKIIALDADATIKQTQGIAAGVPTPQIPLSAVPNPAGYRPFDFLLSGAFFNPANPLGTWDATFGIGFGPNNTDGGAQTRGYLQWEYSFDDGSGQNKDEFHFNFMQGDTTLGLRPFFWNYNRVTGASSGVLAFRGAASSLNIQEVATGDLVANFGRVLQTRYISGVAVETLDGVHGLWLSGGANAVSIGALPPAGGFLRMANGDGVTQMNSAGTHTIYTSFLDAADILHIGHPVAAFSPATILVESPMQLGAQPTALTIGAAGPAAALPATPLFYWSTVINGTPVKIPCYTP